jgi:hypothetical protein
LSERYKIKTFSEVGTLDDQEWHVALEMPTSRMAHAERERESTPTKQHQGKAKLEQLKLNKTYPPTWP